MQVCVKMQDQVCAGSCLAIQGRVTDSHLGMTFDTVDTPKHQTIFFSELYSILLVWD